MMLEGAQRLSRPRLAALLHEARDALPTELGFVQESVDEFIHRIEHRSSLLMMAGQDVEDGRLVEFFEFRHLTFQEFLTARAMVEGWHPGRSEEDTLVTLLEPHFDDEAWREVIPLAAVLGGRETEALVTRLTEQVEQLDTSNHYDSYWGPFPPSAFLLLGDCLADEAAAGRETVRSALGELVRRGSSLEGWRFTRTLSRGRYRNEFLDEAQTAYFSERPNLRNTGAALVEIVWHQSVERFDEEGYTAAADRLLDLLASTESTSRCLGALGSVTLFFLNTPFSRAGRLQESPLTDRLRSLGDALQSMPFSETLQEQYASSFAWVRLGPSRVWTPPRNPDLLGRLFYLWLHADDPELQRMAGWALESQPLLSREDPAPCSSIELAELEVLLERQENLYRVDADRRDAIELAPALLAAWYRRALDDTEIAWRVRWTKDLTPTWDAYYGLDEPLSSPIYDELLDQLEPAPGLPSAG